GVLRRLGRKQSNAAGPLDLATPIEHRLALGKAQADRGCRILPSQLMRIEERAFQLRPESPRTAARGRRADDARIRAPRRAQALDVVARHQDVAVRHDDPVVRGRTPALADVIDLRILASRLVTVSLPSDPI